MAFFNTEKSKNTYMELNVPKMLSTGRNSFKISFMLHRITNELKEFNLAEDLTFLSLKKSQSDPKLTASIYYLFSINKVGYLNLKKVKTNIYQSPDLGNIGSYSQLWSLTNQKINLNEYKTGGFAFKISLKLNEKFIEIKVNDTNLSRFELFDSSSFYTKTFSNQQERFEIETIKMANFESLSSFNFKNSFNSFLIYDLMINNNYFLFSNSLRLTILDNSFTHLKTINNEENLNVYNLIAFNSSQSDFNVIEEMNKNELFCRSKEMTDIYSIGNGNFSLVMPTLNFNDKK